MNQNNVVAVVQNFSTRGVLPCFASTTTLVNGDSAWGTNYWITPATYWGGNVPIHTSDLNPVWNY
jgi:hypothetical protein